MIGTLVLWTQLTVTVSAPDSVAVREPITVIVRVSAPAAGRPSLAAPRFNPLLFLRGSEAARVEPGNYFRAPWLTVEYRYDLAASRPGTYTISPFIARMGSREARTRPLRVTVRATLSESQLPSVVTRAHIDTTAGVNFKAVAAPETVFVGQQTTYEVGVFLDDDVRLRLRRNPEFVPPEPRSVMAYDLPSPHRVVPARIVGSRRYEVHTFQRAFFPLTPGRFVIPQARLVYSLPLTSSFFSREESFTVRADSLTVIALEPPAEHRPDGFLGAVGDLRLEAVAESVARVGDPLVVTARVSGTGNVKLFPRPMLKLDWGSAVAADERVRLDTSSSVVRGAKEFDWIVTPQRAGPQNIPAFRYPYFNPFTERYEIASSGSVPVAVGAGALASDAATTDTIPLFPLRLTLGEATNPPVTRHPAFWWLAAGAPIPALLTGLRRRARRPRARRRAVVLRALSRRAGARPGAVRAAFLGAIAERTGVRGPRGTSGSLARALRHEGVTPELAHEIESLLDELDRAVYSRATIDGAQLARRAAALQAQLERQARPRLQGSPVFGALVIVGTIATASSALTPAPARQLFAEGVTAYRARQFRVAERRFAEVAAAAPTTANAWANFGTAAWAAADTTAAAVGWQRALRLQPLASDLRGRMTLLPATADRAGFVPPVDATTLGLLALGAWFAACALAYRRGSRRSRLRAAGMLVPALGAAALVAGAFRVEAIDAGHGLAVVADDGPARTLPALGADQAAMLRPGVVVRFDTTRAPSLWARVALGAGREGWVERDRLVSLARADAPAIAADAAQR